MSTKQGIYVCAADGTFLSSINSTSPDAVLKSLKKGLEAYGKLAKNQRASFDAEKIKAKFRWESLFPTDGLALAVYSRDLPADHNPAGKRPERWNRDSTWFDRSEIENAMPKGLSVGEQFTLPAILSHRLLRMNFVDTVRGQTDPFSGGEIEANITCVVTKVTDDKLTFTMAGETKASSTSTRLNRTPRGVVTKVSGSASYSYIDVKFDQFDLVAVGYRWGRTRFNGRRRGPEFNPLGYVVSIVPSDESPNVPGLVHEYDSAWLDSLRPADGS